MLIGFCRRSGSLFLECSIDQNIPALPVLSDIRSGEEFSICTLGIWLHRFGLLDCYHNPGIPGLHSFCIQLGQDNFWTLRKPSPFLPMEWDLQSAHRLPHPSFTITDGLAVERPYPTENRIDCRLPAGCFVSLYHRI